MVNKKSQVFLYSITFLAYSLLLAGKDLVFKHLIRSGVSAPIILQISGITCLIFGLFINSWQKLKLRIQSPKNQIFRFIINGFFWITLAQAFHQLNATSIALVSKAYIPLLILFGPFLGATYLLADLILAFLALASIAFFVFFSHDSSESLIGFAYLFCGIGLVMGEYILLRTSTRNESPLIVIAAPALAMIIFGIVSDLGQTASIYNLPLNSICLSILCGLLIYGVYYASIFRYRILPLGLAEFPALIAALIILPAEYFFHNWIPSPLYLYNIGFMFLTLGAILWRKVRS